MNLTLKQILPLDKKTTLNQFDQFCISVPYSTWPSYSFIPYTGNGKTFDNMKKKVEICDALIKI